MNKSNNSNNITNNIYIKLNKNLVKLKSKKLVKFKN